MRGVDMKTAIPSSVAAMPRAHRMRVFVRALIALAAAIVALLVVGVVMIVAVVIVRRPLSLV